MKKKRYVIAACALAFLLALGGLAVWFLRSIPPGEEWLSYESEELVAAIDRQLEGLDPEGLAREKEHFVLGQDLETIQRSVARGDLTYEELTVLCLYRIKTLDQRHHGYNSVAAVAPTALEQARAKDRALAELTAAGQTPAPLFGIPVMLKDNINTADMPTSAGAQAFSNFFPKEDAPLVEALRAQGAVILGKNNLSEFAYYVSSVMPSGYSGKKGQTMNPFGPRKISPSGSSSGSAVAVALDLAPVSIGTETAGSIVGPAAANSVVGFKPTRDSVPAEGIFPLIRRIDTPGPIAKTVADAALAYGALSDGDVSFSRDDAALRGARVGLAVYDYNDADVIQTLRGALEAAGAQVVPVELDQRSVSVQTLIPQTFKRDFEAFARQYGLPISTLEELIRYNAQDEKRRARYGQDLLEIANAVDTPDDTQIEASVRSAREALDALLSGQKLDAVVFLNTSASSVAAAAGYPELTVPLGLDAQGVPQGATFAAGAGEDCKLLRLGYAFEQSARGRQVPAV